MFFCLISPCSQLCAFQPLHTGRGREIWRGGKVCSMIKKGNKKGEEGWKESPSSCRSRVEKPSGDVRDPSGEASR